MDVKTLSKIRYSGLLLIFLAGAILGLSTYYYRSFETNPVSLWHGANMGARSLFFDSEQSVLPIDSKLMARVSEKLEKGEFTYSISTNSDISQVTKTDFQIKNQIATNQVRDSRLKKDLERLEQVNQQLLNSKSTLDALNQDYSNVEAYKQAEVARRADIQEALDNDIKVPSQEDAQALISNRGQPRQNVRSIPQTVLDNVEKTTGISSEEIDKLMNQ